MTKDNTSRPKPQNTTEANELLKKGYRPPPPPKPKGGGGKGKGK
jgi:hypothetical protein